jgi:hypothetical protein
MARPEKLTDEVKKLITNMRMEHPKRTVNEIRQDIRLFLINKMKKDNSELPEIEIVKNINSKKLPGISAVNKYLTSTNKRIEEPDPEDSLWNTAKLMDEPVRPEVVPILVGLQTQRKAYLSVGLSIREARWLNRLYGFIDIFKRKCPIDGTDYKKETVFLYNALADWSQIYAFGEKIDLLAGIEKSDFSELDACILNNDSTLGYKYVSTFYFHSAQEARRKIDRDEYKESDKTFTSSSFNAQVWLMERELLGHSLGTPDLTHNPLLVYHAGLSSLTWGDDRHLQQFQNLAYGAKIELLVKLRHWTKDKSLPKADELNKLDFDLGGILQNLLKNEVRNGLRQT